MDLDERVKIGGRNTGKFRYIDDILMAESSLKQLMKVKESTKAELQLNIEKTKIWTTEELQNIIANEELEIVKHFVYLSSVINSNGDCSKAIRRLRPVRAEIEELERMVVYSSSRMVFHWRKGQDNPHACILNH